jgi:hypothetical protein
MTFLDGFDPFNEERKYNIVPEDIMMTARPTLMRHEDAGEGAFVLPPPLSTEDLIYKYETPYGFEEETKRPPSKLDHQPKDSPRAISPRPVEPENMSDLFQIYQKQEPEWKEYDRILSNRKKHRDDCTCILF